MKKILKYRYISFILALLMVVGVFFPQGLVLAKDSGKYSIEIGIKINDKDNLKKEVKDGGTIEPSARQVMVYKLKVDEDLSEDARLDLAEKFHKVAGKELTIKEAEEKLKKEGYFVKDGSLSEKSKLVYDGKTLSKLVLKKGEDPKLEKLSGERIVVDGLEEGYYLVKETDESKSIDNEKLNTFVVYLSDKTTKTVDGKKVLEINAKETKVVPKKTIKLIKVDADNKDIRLNQVQFQLYRKNKDGKGELVKVSGEKGKYFYDELKGAAISLETWDKGEIVVENLPEGTYYFKEIKPAPGYDYEGNTNKDKESDPVKAGEDVVVTNGRMPTIMKIDDKTGAPLYDAKFKLFTKDDKLVKFTIKDGEYVYDPNGKDEMVASSKQGSIFVRDLPNGTYYFMEVEPPNGYYIKDTDKKYSFDYKDGQMKVHDGGYYLSIGNPKIHTDTNDKPTGGYNFVKIDTSNDEKRLGGAKFTLWKVVDKESKKLEKVIKDDKQVTLVSKDNGEFGIDGLEYGDYALKEVEAPKDHTIMTEYTYFTVDAASKSLPASKIKNKPFVPIITTNHRTTTTVYTPQEFTKIIRSPLVKTGDIRIVLMAIGGFILLAMGIKLVNSGERWQRV